MSKRKKPSYQVIGFDTETYLGKDRRHHFLSFQVYSEDTKIAKVLGKQEPIYDERGVFKGYKHILSWISYRKEDFLKLMRHSIRNAVFFTFNLDFDIAVVAEILKPLIEEGKVTLKLFHSGGRTIMARLTFQKSCIRFLDLKNIFMVRSLAKLGKIVGIEKLEKPPLLGSYQLKELIETNEEVRRLFEAYAIQDAKICFYAGKYIMNLIERPRSTIGSISVHKFFEEYARKPRINKHYVDTLFSFPRYPDSLKAKIKKAYRGGRVEVFKRGTNDEEVRYYDVNSLYPYVMYTNRFPLVNTNKLGRFVSKASVNLDFDGVALVKVRVEAEVPRVRRQVREADIPGRSHCGLVHLPRTEVPRRTRLRKDREGL